MGSLGRSIRRKQQLKEQKESRKDMKEKLQLNSMLPEACVSCTTPFNKTDKQMLDEWYVVVHKQEQIANLYCPTCWERAREHLGK